MFSAKNVSGCVIAKAVVTMVVLLGFLGMTSGAMANPQSAGAQAKQVKLVDLDLSTAEGQRAALGRLHEMARILCSRVADDLDLSHHTNYLACVDSAMAGATSRLQALTARDATENLARNQ